MDEAAVFESELEGGRGVNVLSVVGRRGMGHHGYVESEWAVAGEASAYDADLPLPRDGRWEARPAWRAPYRTRVLVRRPADPAACSGTVVVEWLNVSAGQDSCPDWSYLSEELLRRGHVWIGVSAQQVGISGGASLVGLPDHGGLVGIDPERYGALHHPGDAFSYDIFTQVGRAVAHPGAGGPLDGVPVTVVLAIGESQSAFRLAGYCNAVQPQVGVFDGVLIHSRGGFAADLTGDTRLTSGALPVAIVRDDLEVPVLMVQDEGDLLPPLSFLPARQSDHDRFRLWEIAGSAHADAFQLGGDPGAMHCSHLVNDGPQHLVVKAALAHLDRWARGGDAPPAAPRLTARLDHAGPDPSAARIVRDRWGNALGGLRSPFVDVPAATVSGAAADCGNPLCRLFGTTVPFAPGVLRDLYRDHGTYLEVFEASARAMAAAGFALTDDLPAATARAEAHEAWFG